MNPAGNTLENLPREGVITLTIYHVTSQGNCFAHGKKAAPYSFGKREKKEMIIMQ